MSDDDLDADLDDAPDPAEAARWARMAAAGFGLWCVGSLALLYQLLVVTPAYKETFQSMGVTLPFVTRVLLDVSDWIRAYWFLSAPLLLAGLVASCVPFRVMVDRRAAGIIYLALGVASVVLSGLAWLAHQLPIWELRRALGQ